MFLGTLGSLDVWKRVFDLKNDLVIGSLQSAFTEVMPASVSNTISRLVAGSLVEPLSSNSLVFKVTGTQHILALSGFHISVVVNSCRKIYTSFFNKKLQLIFNCVIVLSYFMLVGFSFSLLRAVCMYVISTLFIFFERQKNAFLLLLYTLIFIILIDISILNEISFQLSFVATTAIFLYSKLLKENFFTHFFVGIATSNRHITTKYPDNHIKKLALYTGKIFSISIFIQLALLPLLSHYFGTVSLLSPIVSIFIMWIFPIIVPIGLLLFFLSFFFPSIFLYPFYIVVSVLTTFVLFFLQIFNFPNFLVPIPKLTAFESIFIYVLIILIYSVKILLSRKTYEKKHKNTYHFDRLCSGNSVHNCAPVAS